MNDVVNNLLLTSDRYLPRICLYQTRCVYSASGGLKQLIKKRKCLKYSDAIRYVSINKFLYNFFTACCLL